MAAGYTNDYANTLNNNFIDQITIAMLNAAVAVAGEANTVTGHALRTAFATKVLLNPQAYTPCFVLAVVSDDATAPGATDTAVQTRVNSLINAFAGVYN